MSDGGKVEGEVEGGTEVEGEVDSFGKCAKDRLLPCLAFLFNTAPNVCLVA